MLWGDWIRLQSRSCPYEIPTHPAHFSLPRSGWSEPLADLSPCSSIAEGVLPEMQPPADVEGSVKGCVLPEVVEGPSDSQYGVPEVGRRGAGHGCTAAPVSHTLAVPCAPPVHSLTGPCAPPTPLTALTLHALTVPCPHLQGPAVCILHSRRELPGSEALHLPGHGLKPAPNDPRACFMVRGADDEIEDGRACFVKYVPFHMRSMSRLSLPVSLIN